jgi:TolB-like protein/Tfp pilus assembly protein PilF
MIGTTICHYRVSAKLGSGGMGVVYQAEDTRLGRQVALKFLPPELANDEESLQRFRHEARATSALNHPGICTVYAIEQADSQQFIVMELLEGESLAEKLNSGPLHIDVLLDTAIQIADALEAAHAKGIVHRDLKPGNIFINARGQTKVLDFGLARTIAPAGPMESTAPLTNVGTILGTIAYMSPEQARGQLTDARTDLFSFGTVLYELATGGLPFQGDTAALLFDAILNRDPAPLPHVELDRVVRKLLEKNRNLRYQNVRDLLTDLMRLKRDLASDRARADNREAHHGKSVAVLYLENLSGAKEDEYLRDGVTEDIVTELAKIRGLKIFSRATVLPWRDRPVTPAQIGQQLGAAYVLTGSLRRAGTRLRINAQLVDTRTGFPSWSERYDREMEDVFELQDEIAHRIAEALRITLTPEEQEALAAKPTENLQAYDLFLRARSYWRRMTRQDLEFALQMLETAVLLDPDFAIAHAAMATICAYNFYHYDHTPRWLERAVESHQRAKVLSPNAAEVHTAAAWILYSEGSHEEAHRRAQHAIARNPDCEGAYYILLRSAFAGGLEQEVLELAETAIASSAGDYNILVPISITFRSRGLREASLHFSRRAIDVLQAHLAKVPEDARARIHLSGHYAYLGRSDDALREANFAMALRPNESTVLYNLACIHVVLDRRAEALETLKKAWEGGFRDINWARRDPDLVPLHGDPEFDRLYPPPA